MEVSLAMAADIITPPGIPAPYGRACANCSRAKCRCIYRTDSSDCERCHRLKKDCRPSIPVRRKAASSGAAKRSSSSTLSRTAQLEQKLDGLVSLLTAQNSSRAKAAADASARRGSVQSVEGSQASPESIAYSTSNQNSGAASAEPRRVYTIPSGIPSTEPDEFRPLGAGGPDFGAGIVPRHQGRPPALQGGPSSSTAPTTETRASSVSIHGGDASYEDRTCSTLAAKCAGGHLPRTPESSASSTTSTRGYQQQKRTLPEDSRQAPLSQQPQRPQQQPQSQAEAQAHPTTGSHTIGWSFGCFNDAARPREIPTNAKEDDGSLPARDTLNLDASLEPTAAEAEQSLVTFRTTMLPYFPFVHLSPDLTAAQLRRTRPVLWLAILSITCQRVPTHTQLGRSTHLRALFAHRIVFESDKSLDLLQGLLAFMTWVHYTSKRDRPTLSVMSQLAVSLVYDLGLHKQASPCKSLIARLVRDHYQQSLAADDPPPVPPLLDERRAALSCYVLTSKFSIALKRCEPLRWTPRLEEHLYELEAQAETPLDHVLVTQVRLQRVADHIHMGEWQTNDPNYFLDPTSDAHRTTGPDCGLLPAYVARVVRAKINEIRENIPPEARHYEGVQDALLASEMMVSAGVVLPVVAPVASMATIAVVSLRARSKPATQPLQADKEKAPSAASAASAASVLPSTVNVARVAALERCVESVAAFWSFFRQITSGSYAALPFAFFAHFTHCVVLLYGLSVMDEPNWDRAAVRDRLHVLDMLDGFIAKLRDAPRVGPSSTVTGMESYDVFNRAATMLTSVRELWASDMGRPDHLDKSKAAAAAAAAAVIVGDRPDQAREQAQQTQQAQQAHGTAVPAAVPGMTMPAAAAAAGPMTLDAPPPPSADGTAWPLSSVAAAPAPSATDMAMGEPTQDPLLMASNDVFFTDLSAAMGIPEDYMLWDLFVDSMPQAQL
ncbi:hypothetical protein SPBR_04655 [Sporothrix brasiliensis 5110]|uniref:Xylanolytic transcriptional activator regulatory domain-containing protein n=1 Tax=Sporothrix brasiliensis 5110 TaxID=1398154 RepID=A0A0C2EN50_9PEZI|nr:uncharacterized protein SPBR_04655 [Sporothrix brasiliensis 5110]KIH87554.1 hypothetical protein SPBR_04655 [Sporothrix brasiliensis 5110]